MRPPDLTVQGEFYCPKCKKDVDAEIYAFAQEFISRENVRVSVMAECKVCRSSLGVDTEVYADIGG